MYVFYSLTLFLSALLAFTTQLPPQQQTLNTFDICNGITTSLQSKNTFFLQWQYQKQCVSYDGAYSKVHSLIFSEEEVLIQLGMKLKCTRYDCARSFYAEMSSTGQFALKSDFSMICNEVKLLNNGKHKVTTIEVPTSELDQKFMTVIPLDHLDDDAQNDATINCVVSFFDKKN